MCYKDSQYIYKQIQQLLVAAEEIQSIMAYLKNELIRFPQSNVQIQQFSNDLVVYQNAQDIIIRANFLQRVSGNVQQYLSAGDCGAASLFFFIG